MEAGWPAALTTQTKNAARTIRWALQLLIFDLSLSNIVSNHYLNFLSFSRNPTQFESRILLVFAPHNSLIFDLFILQYSLLFSPLFSRLVERCSLHFARYLGGQRRNEKEGIRRQSGVAYSPINHSNLIDSVEDAVPRYY